MTLNLIETLKPSIYDPKHTNNTKVHYYLFLRKNETSYFPPKKQNKTKPALYADIYSMIYIAEGYTA